MNKKISELGDTQLLVILSRMTEIPLSKLINRDLDWTEFLEIIRAAMLLKPNCELSETDFKHIDQVIPSLFKKINE